MHIHILGICGTFMSGLAILAKEMGCHVTGWDKNMYPPMSTQLANLGIALSESEDIAIAPEVDIVVMGNVMKRGHPAVEYVLTNDIPYCSGPEWLAKCVLKGKHVIAIAGTHGKTTTTSLLTWILEEAGFKPGFLIGGIPENFGVSARLGQKYFVIEADEYDSAFFDKRSKFIHYHPKTLILNNLEYDHADIFPDLAAIQQQFHYLVRTVPGNGRLIVNDQDENLVAVLKKGCWTPVMTFAGISSPWQAQLLKPDGRSFAVIYQNQVVANVEWSLLGQHNVDNALAAIAAAHQIGISPNVAARALTSFKNVKRRLEVRGTVKGMTVYDDFAHHPTAIETTIAGLRAKIGQNARLVAVLEFGSHTMRLGVHKERIQKALAKADMVICKNPEQDWGLKALLDGFKQPTALYDNVDLLVASLVPQLRAGDHILIMSNSSFGGIHDKLLQAIEKG